MRRRLAAAVVFLLAPAAHASDWFGFDGGVLQTMGPATDFAQTGSSYELYWQHYNRGRSALQFAVGYMELGLDGAVQNTIAQYHDLELQKNLLAQLQGGPGNGYIVAEYGVFTTTYLSANILAQPWRSKRFAAFVTGGAGLYMWRLPFRIKFFSTPFFGEQHAYDPPGTGSFYNGVLAEDQIDFTKDGAAGGLNAGLGFAIRLNSRVQATAQLRGHVIFSSGTGNREEGVDDQDYLNRITLGLLRGGIAYRF